MWKPSSAERYLVDSITGWLLLASFIYAPTAYGSARPAHASFLALWLLGVFVLTSLKWAVVERRLPRVPLMPLLLLLLVNTQGWLMVADPKAFYDKISWRFVFLEKAYPLLPGTMDRTLSLEGMWVISGLSLGFILLADLTANPIWRRRLLMTMAITGAVTAFLGLVLKVGGRPLMELVWDAGRISNANFAFYRYHGNAAVFLYLTWPLAFAFFLSRLAEKKQTSPLFGWFFAFALIFIGVMVNISKTGVFLSTVMLSLFLWWRWKVNQRRKKAQAPSEPLPDLPPSLMSKVYRIMAIVIWGIAMLFIVATAINSISGWSRLVDLGDDVPFSRSVVERILVYQTASDSLSAAGWFGFGPDTFSIIFPFYSAHLGKYLYGFWLYAHEDYLQTLMEWGRVGAGLWGLFYFGGLLRGFWNWRRPDNFSSSENRLLLFACCLGLSGAAIHALFDFPFQIASLRLYLLANLAVCWNSHYFAKELTAAPRLIRKRKRARSTTVEEK